MSILHHTAFEFEYTRNGGVFTDTIHAHNLQDAESFFYQRHGIAEFELIYTQTF